MNKQFIAKQSIVIDAPAGKVWDALVNPEMI
ncbi:MAG TPA: ATPase, partial [Bacteroidetes bacterium]|nr:ATPase [Bacteroidota bacterium]